MRVARFTGVIGIVVLIAAIAAVFGRGLDNGFVYDDTWLIERNTALQEQQPLRQFLATPLFDGAPAGDGAVPARLAIEYWRPFVKFALWVQYRVFGLRAAGYHAVSLAVHAISALLLFWWLSRRLAAPQPAVPARLSGMTSDPRRTVACLLATALFALHPVRVETVAWASGCTDLWMAFWVLAGLVVWDRPGRAATVAASAAFVLAFFSKEAAIVVPACLVLDAWARGRLDRPAVRRIAWPVAALLAALVTWVIVVPPSGTGFAFGGVARVLATAALYAGRILWPVPPSTHLGTIGPAGVFEFGIAILAAGAAVVAAIVLFTTVAGRTPRLRPWMADAGWVVLPLLPVANVFAIGYSTLAAERFLALPLVGVAALCARAVVTAPRAALPAVGIALAAAVVAGAVVAARYVPQFRDDATLWRYETRVHPQSANLFLFLAHAELGAGRTQASEQAALGAYERARTPDTAGWAALAWAAARLQSLPDADPEALVRLRIFYDTLIDAGHAEVDAGGTVMRVAPTRTGLDLMRNSGAVQNARILLHVRTESFAMAESLLSQELQERPTPAAAANRVRVLALQLRFPEAAAALQSARTAYPQHSSHAALEWQLRNADAWLGGAESDPLRRDTTRALLWLYFGSLPLARAALAPMQAQYPDAIETAVIAQLVEAASGRVHEAREYLLNQRMTDPANMPAYEWGLGQLPVLTSPGTNAVSGGLDAPMR